MKLMQCGCHCIKCDSIDLISKKIRKTSSVALFFSLDFDGYYGMHHTCRKCNTHFDHLEGEVFDFCKTCNYKSS